MGWFSKLFKGKRQKLWVLNVQRDMPVEYLLELLRLKTPVISAREYSKLPRHLQQLFVPSRGR